MVGPGQEFFSALPDWMMIKMNVGDFIFYDFELAQIKQMDKGQVREISTGYSSTSGRYLTAVRPLTLRNKNISDYFYLYYHKLHALKGMNLNFPEIKHYITCLWEKACDAVETEEEKELKAIYDTLRDFCDKVTEYSQEQGSKQIHGIPVLRTR